MSYTMTFDASHKVKGDGGHVTTFLHHIARDVDERNGVGRRHANPNIDPARTLYNVTMVNDGAGGFKRAQSVGEIDAYLKERIATVKRKLRSDAVLLRPFILQLDPQWFDDHAPDWKTTGDIGDAGRSFQDAALQWACDKFGQKRIVATSLHLDEYNPQLQVVFTPVTDDGRLAQKDFFPNPTALRKMHDELRDHMEVAGYEVDRARSSRSTEHLSSEEYAAKADRVRKAEATVDAKLEELKEERASLAEYSRHLDDRDYEIRMEEAKLPRLKADAYKAGRAVAEEEVRSESREATSEVEALRRLLREALESAEEYRTQMKKGLQELKALSLTVEERAARNAIVTGANASKDGLHPQAKALYARFPELARQRQGPQVADPSSETRERWPGSWSRG